MQHTVAEPRARSPRRHREDKQRSARKHPSLVRRATKRMQHLARAAQRGTKQVQVAASDSHGAWTPPRRAESTPPPESTPRAASPDSELPGWEEVGIPEGLSCLDPGPTPGPDPRGARLVYRLWALCSRALPFRQSGHTAS